MAFMSSLLSIQYCRWQYSPWSLYLMICLHWKQPFPLKCPYQAPAVSNSPLKANVMEQVIHTSKQYVNFIVGGVSRGFRIGCRARTGFSLPHRIWLLLMTQLPSFGVRQLGHMHNHAPPPFFDHTHHHNYANQM